jgi:hypothetical protein
MTAEDSELRDPFETIVLRWDQWVDRLRGLGAKVAASNWFVALTVAPRLRFFTALRFPKEFAFEREGFVIQSSA